MTTPKHATWTGLADEVRRSGGVLHVKAAELRETAGAGSLKVHVRQDIRQALATEGLTTFPAEIPGDGQRGVVLLAANSPAARLVAAVQQGRADQEYAPQLARLNTPVDTPDLSEHILKSEVRTLANEAAAKLIALADKLEG